MSGLRKCSKCGGLMKIKDEKPEPMGPDGRFPEHVCKRCREATGTRETGKDGK